MQGNLGTSKAQQLRYGARILKMYKKTPVQRDFKRLLGMPFVLSVEDNVLLTQRDLVYQP